MTISRRNLLKSAAGIATGATLPRHLSAQNALLVSRDAFIRALDKRGLTIVWSILGEKLYH